MIYIFIFCIILLLVFCIFSQQQSIIIAPIQESFKNESESESPAEEESGAENAKMGAQWEREIKDSTFKTEMPSQIT
jgi:hypothetical protein